MSLSTRLRKLEVGPTAGAPTYDELREACLSVGYPVTAADLQ